MMIGVVILLFFSLTVNYARCCESSNNVLVLSDESWADEAERCVPRCCKTTDPAAVLVNECVTTAHYAARLERAGATLWRAQSVCNRDEVPPFDITTSALHCLQEVAGCSLFIPHPHRAIAESLQSPFQCKWITGAPPSGSDKIQAAAYKEGMCVDPSGNYPLHVFSTAEARQCLHHRKIAFSGDSYEVQFYIGLADILIGNPENDEITGSAKRQIVFKHRVGGMSKLRPDLQVEFVCTEQYMCYGLSVKTALKNCAACLAQHAADVLVIGTTVHLFQIPSSQSVRPTDFVLDEISDFFDSPSVPNLLWNTGPSYRQGDLFYPLNDTDRMAAVVSHVYPLAQQHNLPILDFFSMTAACVWKNCSTDGGHRARFVNRWKGQMLLNMLCDSF